MTANLNENTSGSKCQYKEQVGGQKRKEEKLIEIEGVGEWEVERILNKRKVREVEKYLV